MRGSGIHRSNRWGETIPSHLRALAATDQSTSPQSANTTPEERATEPSYRAPHGIGNNPDNLPKPFADLARTVMLPALKLGLNGFELRNHPLRRRDSPDGKSSATPEMPTIMREPQEYVKVSGFPSPRRFSVSEGKPPELDQSRLVRMQFQTELRQPLLKITQESLGVSPVLKAQHNDRRHNGRL